MDKLGLLLAVAALGVAGYVAMDASDRASDVADLEQGVTDLQNSMGGIEAKLDALLKNSGPRPTAMTASSGGGMTPLDESSETSTGLATRDAPAARTADERLAALEKTIAEQKETIAKLEDENEKGGRISRVVSNALGNRFYHSVDAAAKSLKLTDAQKQSFDDIAERARRELKDLRELPNDNGDTWNSVGKITLSRDSGEDSVISLMGNMKKIRDFKKTTIPGTNETYGDAEKRIKNRAFADMREELNGEQAENFDKAHKDAMLGSRSGMAFSFSEAVVVGEEPK